jgi:hypothetical protein
VKRTAWSEGLSVSGDRTGVVAHTGSAGLRLLADRTGLTGELSIALARRVFVPRRDRGHVLTDVAVMLADGGERSLTSPTVTSAMWRCWMWMPRSWRPTVRKSRRHQL